MHTSTMLKTEEFSFARDGLDVGLDEIFPDFNRTDRLGIVSASPGDSLRAAPLLLAAIGAFYEQLWEEEEDEFFLYPDYFVFHIGELTGYHSPFDIWPQSKEVIVHPDPQALLAAINDRGITRLILPSQSESSGSLMEHAVQHAEREVRSIVRLVGETEPPRWTVSASDAATKMIKRCARVSAELLGEEAAAEWTAHPDAPGKYSPVEFDEGMRRICGIGTSDPSFGFSEEYRAAASVSDAILARDIRPVHQVSADQPSAQ
ncbi:MULTISPECIES: hypothetical protein [unclassified Brevibacterium]|uniref:hypothetical protein n=1 Tax=unclassified Brevibacterium TaxID=2614124 RepID=UPI0010923EDE|nr:hypothetical protein [Brevibacterium sp. S22]TGD30275.1 hypothetical protein EB835_13470 [Brevibacterium sp. S22]